MATLVSPGVSVTVTDESFYASAGQGTIPLVVFATAANKKQSGSATATAPGTISSNANKLYLMTSQRDVLQTFGDPKFYSVGGSQQYDNELNEVGLFSLYQYLGIANTAYAIRADINLSQLQPKASEPRGAAANGDYWLDLNHTTWGIFRSNGNPNSAYAWQSKTPLIISTASNLEKVVQGQTTGSYLIMSASDSIIVQSGALVINGISVALTAGDSISTVVSKINNTATVQALGIKATIFIRTEKYDLAQSLYGDVFHIRLISSDIDTTITLTGSSTNILTYLGLSATPTNTIAPADSFGTDGRYAVDTVGTDGSGNIINSIWEKIVLTTSSSTKSWWFKVGSQDNNSAFAGWGWREAEPRVVTGTIANPTFTPGEQFSIKVGDDNRHTMTVPAAIAPATVATLSQIVLTINTKLNEQILNAVASINTVGSNNYLRITNYDGTDLWFNDISNQNARQTPWGDAGVPTTQTYYSSVTGTVANPTFTASTVKTSSAVPVQGGAGAGYAVGDVLTVSGGVYTQASVLSVNSIQTSAAVPNANGNGYSINDTLTFTGNGFVTPVILTVTDVGGSGDIISLTVSQAGQYTGNVAPTIGTSPSSATNNNLTATVNLTWGVGTVSVTTAGTYSTYPTNPASATGGSGSGVSLTLTPAFASGQQFTINAGSGAVNVHVPAAPDNSLAGVVDAINAAFPTGPIVASATTDGKLKIANTNNTSFVLDDITGLALNNAGVDVGYVYGRLLTYQGYSPSLTVPNTLQQLADTNVWINTTSADRGANYVVKRYIDGGWVQQNTAPNTGTVPMYSSDAYADAGFGANKQIGSIYVRYNSTGASPARANHQLFIWDGSAWAVLVYTPSVTTPDGPPNNGTIWYSTALRYDIMVNNGRVWKGYRNMYPGTDINGPLLSSTQPIAQSTGASLVDNDIWIDTDVTTTVKIYRYDATNQIWHTINNADSTTPAGILFADARPNTTGLADGSTMIADMVLSDYVDDDAPDAMVHPAGMVLLNTRYSTNNVKKWSANYFPALPEGSQGRWVTASGNASNGTPYMGYLAQRQMIVTALQASLASNQDARAENTFFNLLATPGYPECIDEMVTLNTDKKEIAFIIGDTPARLSPDGTSIQTWATNANNTPTNGSAGLTTANPYVGLYYPWALSTNIDGSDVFVPPSMMALRTYAYNDQVAYPWFAPAGFNRGLVTGVTSVGYLLSNGSYQPLTLNQGQRDVMYTNKINPIAYIPNRGLVVYGQKTLSPVASALDRVNVARLINYLKYQLDNLAKPFLFEPNDTQTRQAVNATFNSFMGSLAGLRALYDFAVVCDDSNNTPERIDRNELWIDVAIKPEKAIEFIYIPIRILNTGDPLPNGSQNATA